MEPSKLRDLAPVPAGYPTTEIVPHPGAPSSPPALASTPDALSLLKALRRRWMLALGLGLLLAGTAGPAAWFLVPKSKYTAKASLFVMANPRRVELGGPGDRTELGTYQRTMVALLKDPFVLADAINKPEVASLPTIKELDRRGTDPEEWLEQSLKAEFPGGSEVLTVSLSGDHSEDLATIVNQVVASYMTLVVDREHQDQIRWLGQLDARWEQYEKQLAQQRKDLEQSGSGAPTDPHNPASIAMLRESATAQLGVHRAEQTRVLDELHQAKAKLAALTAGSGPGPDDEAPGLAPAVSPAAIEEQVSMDPDVAKLAAQVDTYARDYWDLRRKIRSEMDPALQGYQRRWMAANEQLKNLRERVREEIRRGITPGPRGGGANPLAEVTSLRQQVNDLEAYQKSLTANIDALQQQIVDLNREGLNWVAKQDAIDVTRDFARRIRAAREQLQSSIGEPRVRKLSDAKPPRAAKDDLRRVKVGGVAALGSFALAVLGVSFWEFRARRIDGPDEVVSALGLRLVGALPALPARTNRPGRIASSAVQRWQGLLVESIDAVRTMLLHASRARSIRVVMITSAVKGEGKTSLACHLATSLARAGRKTLLIDGDLRSPAAHRLFDLLPEPGLCDVLRGEAGVANVVQPTCATGLDLVPAGHYDALALQALARDALPALLAGLRTHYDFIIIDSAPVLPVTDSLLIGQCVDGVLFSVLRDVSRLPAVYEARERLASLGIPMLGAVVSGVQGANYASDYYAYGQAAAESR